MASSVPGLSNAATGAGWVPLRRLFFEGYLESSNQRAALMFFVLAAFWWPAFLGFPRDNWNVFNKNLLTGAGWVPSSRLFVEGYLVTDVRARLCTC